MDLSIVIPTRDRPEVLAANLDVLAEQDLADGFEVIVVVDGEDDEATRNLLEARDDAALRFFIQPRRGPAAARNRGVAEAQAMRILLLGDDTLPTQGCLEAHLTDEAVGIQGHIDWDPSIEITPVMEFLAPEGPQFYFKGLEDEGPIPWTAILGSNFSAPTQWFRDTPFDENFPAAAFEDSEVAWRWRAQGRGAIYRRRARCLHRHSYPAIKPFLARQRRAGRAARYAVGKHPRMLGKVVLEPALFGGVVLGRHLLRSLSGRRRQEDAWDLACRAAFLRGVLF